jgi:two-component system LytT family response regulator
MIKCIAIDDEPLALKQLETYIKKTPFLELEGAFPSATKALEFLNSEPVDAMFLDINMPDLNGMDFAKELSAPPMIVFTTAYSEFAIDSYKVNAVDYLLKPFGMDDFLHAADKVKERYDYNHAAVSAISSPETEDAIFFKTEYKVVRVSISQITYIEGMSEYLKIHTVGETEPVIVLLSFKKLEDRLPKKKFMRIHKSYLINLDAIKEVTRGHVLMQNNVSLPVGDAYKDEFNSWIDTKFIGK